MDAIERVNTHGLNRYQSKIKIDSAIRKAGKSTYRLRIVHGYNLGTEIKEMVWEEYQNHPKIKRITEGGNPGETDLIFREI